MRSRLAVAALAATLITLFLTSPAQASHQWENYHWSRTSNPFTLQFTENLTSNWDPIARAAATDWAASSVLNITVTPGAGSAQSCTAISGRARICNHTYGLTGWLGNTTVSFNSSGHILSARVQLNDTYFNMAEYNTPEERRRTTCHEIGHSLGLDHQDEDFDNPNLGTCLDLSRDPGTNQQPNNHDYSMLQTIYSHLDSSSTAGSSSVLAMTLPDDPAHWGEVVEGDVEDGHSVYIRDLGHGYYVATHVTWAT